jgi:hypothetical protein
MRFRLPYGRHSVPHAMVSRPKGKTVMRQIVLDAEAGQVSAELSRRGIATHARVHVRVEVIAEAGKGFDWLAEEPDLYSDADLVERAS